jgi:hypothetical protein
MAQTWLLLVCAVGCSAPDECTYVFEAEYQAEPGECLTLTANGSGTYFQFTDEPEPSACDHARRVLYRRPGRRAHGGLHEHGR